MPTIVVKKPVFLDLIQPDRAITMDSNRIPITKVIEAKFEVNSKFS